MEPEGRRGKPIDDDRGELAPESDVLVRESEPSTDGVGARSWSEEWGRCRRLAPSCSWKIPLPLDVDASSLGRPESRGIITGTMAGVLAPVPLEESEGEPEGVARGAKRAPESCWNDDDGETSPLCCELNWDEGRGADTTGISTAGNSTHV